VAGFGVPAVEVKIADILVRRCVPKEQTSEVVFVEFGAAVPCLFDAYACTEQFQVLEIWFCAPPSFKWCDTSA
jgi:hypothetical protein